MIPTINTITIVALLIASVLLPVAGWFIVWRKTRARIADLLVGMGVFFVCYVIAIATSLLGQMLIASPIILVLVLALRAGLVEEFGRFIAFKFFLKRSKTIGNGLMYGVGHGGMEVLLVYTLAMVSNLVFIVMVNTGSMDMLAALAPDQTEALDAAVVALRDTSPLMLSVGLVERVAAMILHISLSVIVFCAVRQKKWLYLVLAIVLHTLADSSIVLYITGTLNLWGLEAIIMAMSLVTAIIAWLIARGYKLPVDLTPSPMTPNLHRDT